MKNGVAILAEEALDQKFWRHVEIANGLPPTTPDNMLIAYSYYKQATMGDISVERPTGSSMVIETFKYDAWKRLEGMPKKEAMKLYIKTINALRQEN